MADFRIYLVEVTSDHRPAKKELWLAAVPRHEAVNAVLAEIPEGWAARLTPLVMSSNEVNQLKMAPGTVRKLR